MIKFKIEKDICIGCGLCQAICSDCFVLENGIARAINSEENSSCCDFQEVIDSCPCQAIKKN